MREFLKLFRVKQYIKNFFIFLPLFFSLNVLNIEKFTATFFTFVIFSLIASSIYIINDIVDVEQDKNHPVKKNRPIASGKIGPKTALFTSFILSICALFGAIVLNKYIFFIILFYYLMNVIYSLKLKNIGLVDVFIIAIGFVCRVLAGSVAINVIPTNWIVILTFLLALFLALAKRYDDVVNMKNKLVTRTNVEKYNTNFLIAAASMVASIVIVAYIMYTVSDEVIQRFSSHYIYITSIFVIFGILRYLQLVFVKNELNSCPTEILYSDKYIIFSILFWLSSFVILIYL